jgi:predicted porin
MKKTLIAAGIAAVVAAPAFAAEVKVGGQVEQAFTMIENGDFAGDHDTNISVSASEDLGNGLTAFAKIVIDTDTTAQSDSNDNKDQYVGLKGSFGTLMTGRMESFMVQKIYNPLKLNGGTGADGNEAGSPAENAAGWNVTGRNSDAIAYLSPSVNGLSIGVASYTDNVQDVTVMYSNGPLAINVGRQMTGGTAAQEQDTTMANVSYAMGDLKGTLTWGKDEVAGGATDGTSKAARLDYKMGNNTLTALYADFEANTGADNGDSTALELTHNFSKQTAAYVSYVMRDNAGSTADVDYLTFGMYHKF